MLSNYIVFPIEPPYQYSRESDFIHTHTHTHKHTHTHTHTIYTYIYVFKDKFLETIREDRSNHFVLSKDFCSHAHNLV